MPDNIGKRRPMDSHRVNIHEDYEVEFWCQKFGCTRDELVDAVNTVGTSSTAVADYLRQ